MGADMDIWITHDHGPDLKEISGHGPQLYHSRSICPNHHRDSRLQYHMDTGIPTIDITTGIVLKS
jgi:hypothetical protein